MEYRTGVNSLGLGLLQPPIIALMSPGQLRDSEVQVGFWLCNPPSLLPSTMPVNLLCVRNSLHIYLYCYLLLNISKRS